MSGLKNLDQLEETLERDPDNLEQIQFWYEQLNKYEIEGFEPSEQLLLIFRGYKWIMQYEHTSAEELKEVAERQAVEIAEKEENWEQEREMLKEEISALRERITSKAGMDEMNEAFRAEIDSLNSENSHLKQIGRERDRELADQRDKVEELAGKIGVFERERNTWTNAQIQLEDTIRELNRRLSAKTDLAPRNEWESRKLKQRSEQALMLGSQLRNADTQNAELKERVEGLTRALEEATALLQETTKKYEKLRKQFGQTTATAEKLFASNQDLRKMLEVKNEMFNGKQESAELSTQQLEELLRAKESQIQRLREANQQYELEIDELQTRLQNEHSVEREEELEHLRLELVEATKLARQLFGESLVNADEDNQTTNLSVKLRLRIVQINQELDHCRQQLKLSVEERDQLTRLLEQKDARLAQLYAEVDRLRKLAFGDADSHIQELEKQIDYREQQISKLTLKCSLMQLELENLELDENPKRKALPREERRESRHQKRKKEQGHPRTKETLKSSEKVAITASCSTSVSEEEHQLPLCQESPPNQKEHVRSEVAPRKQYNALELIKLFDDNEIGNQTANDFNVLSSLFVELKRLNEQLNERDKQTTEMNGLVNEGRLKAAEQSAKLKQLQDEYDKFRMEIFGNTNIESDVDNLRRTIEELQIENMELQRFVDGIKIGGAELERRFEEATRRLIHLGIQLNQYERKSTNLSRRHQALGEECDRLRVQLMRFQSGDERQLKQMSRENELNMIEIAHLQNALVHSVPLQSYNKLLANFKKLLHTQTIGQLPGAEGSIGIDHGYESDIEKQQLDVSLNNLMTQNRSNEQVLVENVQLKETAEILTKQIDYWKRQHSKQANEIRELSAFLDDLENQTDLKSMIANIERRFLQALHEQSDAVEEQLTNEKELKKLRREISTSKRQWRNDRQKLVEIIIGLQFSLQRLRANATNSLSVTQLIALRTATEELKRKEQTVDKQLGNVELKLIDLERKEALAEAVKESAEQALSSNFQLQDMQLAFQRSAFHIKTLANELKSNQKKLDTTSYELKKQMEENADLRKELDELIIASVDPSKLKAITEPEELVHQPEVSTKTVDRDSAGFMPRTQTTQQSVLHQKAAATRPSVDSEESTIESEHQTPRRQNVNEVQPKQAVIFDNSEECEREISAIKKAARISIQNYKEQLDRKERAIEEYRSLLNKLSTNTTNQHQQQATTGVLGDVPLKRSAEILNSVETEEREKQLIILKWELSELEEANAHLAEQVRMANEAQSLDYGLAVQKQTVSVQTDVNLTSTDGLRRLINPTSLSNDDEEQGQKSPSGESSDSGTAINDLEDEEELDQIDANRTKKRLRIDSKPTNASQPYNSAELQRPLSALSEVQIFQHRSEVRRLRSRISALELKNRELTAEHESLKQRTRYLPQRDSDPNAEVNLLRKENDRMRRENKNVRETLKTQTAHIEELEKKLKRKTEHMRDTIDSWEEKKNLEKELRSAKQRLQLANDKLLEVNDKVERRDRLIENLNRAQNERVFSVDKYKNELARLRKREEEFEKAKSVFHNENLILQEKIRDASQRIEQVLKENHLLRGKLPKSRSTNWAQVQTPAEWMSNQQNDVARIWEMSYNSLENERQRFNYGARPNPIIRSKLVDSATNTDPRPLANVNEDAKKLSKIRMEHMELMRQFDKLSENYENLKDEYTSYKSSQRRESFNTAAVTLLEDKLRAKQWEIDRQRQAIEKLEQQLQTIRINR